MKTELVTFTGSSGQQLSGTLDLPVGAPMSIALFAHCFSCGKDLRAARRVAAQLTAQGIAVFRFDFTGLGRSGGDFADSNFSTNVGDLLAAADWLRQSWGPPELLVGHSLGGSAVIAAAPHIPEVQAVATIGAPADPAHVAHLFEGSLDAIAEQGEAAISIGGRTFTIKQQFIDDIAASQLEPNLASLGAALLVLHAPDDAIVDVSNADVIIGAATGPRSFMTLDGADHLMSDPAQADRAGSLITAWAGHYLKSHVTGSDDVLVPAAEGEVVVAERGTGAFAQVIRVAQRHALLADEPIGIGDDTGPAPYDFLLAALGSCTSMTVRMYADRKGWPLEDVAVRLRHGKVHAQDCATCETETGRVDVIERELVITGDLTDEQRAKLLAIADRCPVHRSLESETMITTELVVD